jgi:hypothetical protein
VRTLLDRHKVSSIGPIIVDHERSVYQLTQGLRAHHQVLEELEGALPEEESISSSGEATTLRPRVEEQRGDVQLHSTS